MGRMRKAAPVMAPRPAQASSEPSSQTARAARKTSSVMTKNGISESTAAEIPTVSGLQAVTATEAKAAAAGSSGAKHAHIRPAAAVVITTDNSWAASGEEPASQLHCARTSG